MRLNIGRDRAVKLAVILVVGIVLGSGVVAGYYHANPVIKTKTVYKTADVTPSEPATKVGVRIGQEAPDNWEYPVGVTFKRYNGSDFETHYYVTATDAQPFLVGLVPGERYQISVEAPDGETRVLGGYTATERGDSIELVVYPCCHDDFSTDTPGSESE